MPSAYEWDCICGEKGVGEAAAQRHAAVCSRFGYPWTNPAWPRPEQPQEEA
jgi:hypothetical protein